MDTMVLDVGGLTPLTIPVAPQEAQPDPGEDSMGTVHPATNIRGWMTLMAMRSPILWKTSSTMWKHSGVTTGGVMERQAE